MKMSYAMSSAARTISAMVGIAFGCSAVAQKSDRPEVTVEAKHAAKRPEATVIATPPATVRLTKRANYADLDLSVPSGVKELEKRINDAAEAACNQLLHQLYVVDASEHEACTRDAIESATVQKRAAIAAAELDKPLRTAKRPVK